MAAIQLGNGEEYEGQISAYGTNHDTDESPSKILFEFITELKDEQRNFPVSIKLDREEGITLIAEIAKALLPRKVIPVQPAKKVLLGRTIS